jgi:hypothetical protein
MAKDGLEKIARPDFTNALIHFTRTRKGKRRHFEDAKNFEKEDQYENRPLDVLNEILCDGFVRGSNNTGFIKGNRTAVCFSEVPLSSVRYFIETERYSPYGIAVSKQAAFNVGGRPVIYVPDAEGEWIPAEEKWRQVRFEYGTVDFTHEREWRVPGDLNLQKLPGFYLLVWNPTDAKRLLEISAKYKNFRGFLPMEHLLYLF